MRLIIILTLFSLSCYGQPEIKKPATTVYAGTFSYSNGKNNPSGTIMIYPETDTTVLFYVDLNKGAPTNASGSLYGRLRMFNGRGRFVNKNSSCQWTLYFATGKLTIETKNDSINCGFGNGVTIDGVYAQISKEIPQEFINGEGKKYFFSATSPEKYYFEKKVTGH